MRHRKAGRQLRRTSEQKLALMRSLASSSESQLEAEIALAEDRVSDALVLQAKAVTQADDADRTEPPMLASSPRQRLGAMQLRAKKFADAENTFRTDLKLHPGSGWSLNGLEKALTAQGKLTHAQTTQRELASSWALAEAQVKAVQ